jgi:5-methylcytosine-specific restriction endonuclease McrA
MSPSRPGRICPRCHAVITARSCPSCYPAWSTSSRRGSTRAWRTLRVYVFAEQSGICAVEGCTELADELDHIVSTARGGGDERSNVWGLCETHHAEKTAHESRGSLPTWMTG